jgi:hypothetical protein
MNRLHSRETLPVLHAWNRKMNCFEWSCRYIRSEQYIDLVVDVFFFISSSHSSHIQEYRS